MRTKIRPAAYGAGRQGSPRWSMFTLNQRDPAQPAAMGVADLFFLPPVAQQVIADRPVEEVLLVRDEMANLAWAIERRYEGGRGIAVERIEEAMSDRPIVPPPNVNASLRYILSTTVPPYWFPLVPEQGINDVRLHLDRMANQSESVQPLGTFLDMNGPSLPDSVVPREGRQLLRDYAFTRWSNGMSYVWSRKRSRIGRGEGSSGLKFDVVCLSISPMSLPPNRIADPARQARAWMRSRSERISDAERRWAHIHATPICVGMNLPSRHGAGPIAGRFGGSSNSA
jgi:hypothetical protein